MGSRPMSGGQLDPLSVLPPNAGGALHESLGKNMSLINGQLFTQAEREIWIGASSLARTKRARAEE